MEDSSLPSPREIDRMASDEAVNEPDEMEEDAVKGAPSGPQPLQLQAVAGVQCDDPAAEGLSECPFCGAEFERVRVRGVEVFAGSMLAHGVTLCHKVCFEREMED